MGTLRARASEAMTVHEASIKSLGAPRAGKACRRACLAFAWGAGRVWGGRVSARQTLPEEQRSLTAITSHGRLRKAAALDPRAAIAALNSALVVDIGKFAGCCVGGGPAWRPPHEPLIHAVQLPQPLDAFAGAHMVEPAGAPGEGGGRIRKVRRKVFMKKRPARS